mmetsp:Transcript_22721/g.69848  ORF Transcript_22721/g.69848 Transcript_22721/m.69848 type:complete len:213 (+) Transcript_22721:139-777(+)
MASSLLDVLGKIREAAEDLKAALDTLQDNCSAAIALRNRVKAVKPAVEGLLKLRTEASRNTLEAAFARCRDDMEAVETQRGCCFYSVYELIDSADEEAATLASLDDQLSSALVNLTFCEVAILRSNNEQVDFDSDAFVSTYALLVKIKNTITRQHQLKTAAADEIRSYCPCLASCFLNEIGETTLSSSSSGARLVDEESTTPYTSLEQGRSS